MPSELINNDFFLLTNSMEQNVTLEILSPSAKTTAAFGQRLGALLQVGDVIAFTGDLVE